MLDPPPLDDDLVTAFREAPVAARDAALVDAAAQRFVRATQEQLVVRARQRRLRGRLRTSLLVAGALGLFMLGRLAARALVEHPDADVSADTSPRTR